MVSCRLSAGRFVFVRAAAVALMLASTAAIAAETFPFDQELLLDVAPMRPVKRVPVLTVSENGSATIDLWCRTVAAHVEISEGAIRIETAPLPEALPQYMSEGQCSDARVAADSDLLTALAQVTEWRRRGGGVELKGADGPTPAPLRFRPSSH